MLHEYAYRTEDCPVDRLMARRPEYKSTQERYQQSLLKVFKMIGIDQTAASLGGYIPFIMIDPSRLATGKGFALPDLAKLISSLYNGQAYMTDVSLGTELIIVGARSLNDPHEAKGFVLDPRTNELLNNFTQLHILKASATTRIYSSHPTSFREAEIRPEVLSEIALYLSSLDTTKSEMKGIRGLTVPLEELEK